MSTEPNKVIYSMVGVSKFYDKKPVLKDIYLSYFYGAKIGVIGLNGSGKSSLLRILAGVDQEFQGRTAVSPGFTIGFLEQEPKLDPEEIGKKMAVQDPLYFTTYYAIDVINFKPANLSSALDTIEGPYLPLIVQEAAGLPLDPSFAEQKRILERCKGLFYACAGGAEARRFNRLLIDAGLIKGL